MTVIEFPPRGWAKLLRSAEWWGGAPLVGAVLAARRAGMKADEWAGFGFLNTRRPRAMFSASPGSLGIDARGKVERYSWAA